jgi:hypothetical protein
MTESQTAEGQNVPSPFKLSLLLYLWFIEFGFGFGLLGWISTLTWSFPRLWILILGPFLIKFLSLYSFGRTFTDWFCHIQRFRGSQTHASPSIRHNTFSIRRSPYYILLDHSMVRYTTGWFRFILSGFLTFLLCFSFWITSPAFQSRTPRTKVTVNLLQNTHYQKQPAYYLETYFPITLPLPENAFNKNSEASQPVFYQLPYQKSAPQQFVPEIVALIPHFKISTTTEPTPAPVSTNSPASQTHADRIIWKGPLTPPTELHDAESALTCLQSLWQTNVSISACWEYRRHIFNLFQKPTHSTLSLVSFDDLTLSGRKIVQIRLKNSTQEQSILIEPQQFAHQRIVWMPDEPSALHSTNTLLLSALLFEEISQKSQFYRDYETSHALMNQTLSQHVNAPVSPTQENSFTLALTQLIQTQALLCSKISNDPKDPLAYYHLSGNAYQLLQLARSYQNSLKTTPLTAIARDLASSALKYGRDVGLESKHLREMERILVEIQGF